MAGVYSQRFLSEVNVIGALAFLVPTGFQLVLRDLLVAIVADGASSISLLNPAGGPVWLIDRPSDASAAFYEWQGRQVWEAGEELTIVADSPGWNVMASGYLLTLP